MDWSTLLIFLSFNSILCYEFKTKYIEVPVDHFSFATTTTFKLKYLINDTFWLADGPVFFYTGNEGDIETFAQNTGFLFDIAPSFNALIVFAEHRYYGASLPFGNLSLTEPKYSGYLTSNQALADYVDVISELQTTYSKSENLKRIPVIAFGGSYGGMLAAWLRMKYPASVVGAIAASAPIWQFTGLTNCETFNRIVTDVYKFTTPYGDCSLPLQKSWKAIRNVAANDTGKSWLSNEWRLCTPLKTNADIDNLIDWFQNILVNIVMVNYPYPTSFLAPLPANPVSEFCSKLANANKANDKELLTIIETALEIYTNYTKQTKCNNINDTASGLGENTWEFQACTEIIMPMCSTDDDLFENELWNFTEYSESCYKKWGVRQQNEMFPILEYGGKNIKSASNIVFSNGLLDPWSSGGVLENVSATVYSVLIPEGAHHLDLRAENKHDPPSVVAARKFHVKVIKRWMLEFYLDRVLNFYSKWEKMFRPVNSTDL